MKNLKTLCSKMVNILSRDHGQDLIEYALVIALVAFGATAGMKALATGINTAFQNISSILNADI